jgi:nitrite reductase/ring-hydroxylating ferredoxin subunit
VIANWVGACTAKWSPLPAVGEEHVHARCYPHWSSTAEVAPGNALKVDKAGLVLAVFNQNGELFVTDDACTHAPGSLSEGFIEGEVVECNFHNGQFNIKTGEVVAAALHDPHQNLQEHRREWPGS